MNGLTIMLIRHAEKPGEALPGSGFTEEGEEDDKSLLIRGWQRAGAWAALFGSDRSGPDFPRPSHIYAATPGERPNHGPSSRPAETASPLAAKLGLKVNVKYGKGDETALVADVLGLSGTVLICWEHQAIVHEILPKIPSVLGRVPREWDKERFDVVLRVDRSDVDGPFALRQLHPCLLEGDSTIDLD